MNGNSRRLPLFLLIFLTLISFWQLRYSGFIVLDDYHYVIDNPWVNRGFSFESFSAAFSSEKYSNWQPLVWIIYSILYQAFGPNAAAFHIFSLVLHLFNCVFVFLILERLISSRWQGFMIAALFAIHPMHVETVAWIAELKDVLSTFFALASFLVYLHWCHSAQKKMLWISATLYLISLNTKPMVITLPILFILVDYWPLKRYGNIETFIKCLSEKWMFWGVLSLFVGIAFWAQNSGGGLIGINELPVMNRVSNSLLTHMAYLSKFLLPIKLCVFYPHPIVVAPAWQYLTSAVFLMTITAVCIQQRNKRPYLIVGWLWFIIFLAPANGLIQFGAHSMANRFTYVPYIGLSIIVIVGLGEMLKKNKISELVRRILAVGIILILVIRTHVEVGYWKTSTTLFHRAVQVTPDSGVAFMNLGYSYYMDNQPNIAKDHLKKAIALKPGMAKPFILMGKILEGETRPGEALKAYTYALQRKPEEAVRGFVENRINELSGG